VICSLLKTACGYGYHEDLQAHNIVDLNNKRYHFVRSYIRLVLSAASKHKNLLDSDATRFEEGIQDILADIVDTIRQEGT
jgi:hypothetical protein